MVEGRERGGEEGRRGEVGGGRGGDGSGGQGQAVMDQPCLSSHNVENRMHGVYYAHVTRRRKASRLIVLRFKGVWRSWVPFEGPIFIILPYFII